MRNTIWEKKIPTLLGVLFLVLGVGMTSFFAQQGTNSFSNASTDEQPSDIRITNVNDTSATISFTTSVPSSATISYGTDTQMTQVASDFRDQGSSPSVRTTHYFILSNLTPNTPYFFVISSGGNKFQNTGQPFQLTTASTLENTTPNNKIISGKIMTASGEIGKDVLMYLTADTVQELSILSGIDGSFSLPLTILRSKDLQSSTTVSDETSFVLLATDGKEQTHVKFILKQADPLPTIILSKDYEFTIGDTALDPTLDSSASAQTKFPSFSSEPVVPGDPQILSPQKQQGVSDSQPIFQGTGKPNESVEITIHSAEVIQSKVLTNKQGQWSYRPSQSLSPGEHTITIKTKNNKGIIKTITQSFTVYAEGSQFQEPSVAPLAPTATPTTAPMKVPSATPTRPTQVSIVVTATSIPSPTAILVTNTPTPTTIVLINTSPTMMVTGDPVIISFGVLMLLLFGTGITLFLLSRGNISI